VRVRVRARFEQTLRHILPLVPALVTAGCIY
jgi:hypothetical protein